MRIYLNFCLAACVLFATACTKPAPAPIAAPDVEDACPIDRRYGDPCNADLPVDVSADVSAVCC